MALCVLPTLSSSTAVLVALVVGAAIAVYAYVTRNFGYWRRKGVPYLRPVPLAGNLKDFVLFRKHIGQVLCGVYTDMKDQPYVGMYFFDQPVLFVKDLTLWKSILHKNFNHFDERGFTPVGSNGFFDINLFGIKGWKWWVLRSNLEHAFTSAKVKRFYESLEKIASKLDHYFDDAALNGTSCDVINACSRYSMEVVAFVTMGIETRSMENENDRLFHLLRDIFESNKWRMITTMASFVNVPALRLLGHTLVSSRLAQFMRNITWRVVRERERAGQQGARGDFLDLLLHLRKKGPLSMEEDGPADADVPQTDTEEKIVMDGDTLVSQVMASFSAGYDATTTLMGHVLYELAKDDAMQEKLRNMLQTAVENHDGKLTLDALQSVEYLGMILHETLRMYPVVPFLDRTCTKDFHIPGTDVVLDKGVFVFTSILGIQRDPKFYPEPERFDPERFSDANKHNIPSGAYFPFGGGGHVCPGWRLSILKSKLAIAHIILNYRIRPSAKTPDRMIFCLNSFLNHASDGVHLNFSRVEKNILPL